MILVFGNDTFGESEMSDWETEIHKLADELWEEAERPTKLTEGVALRDVLKLVATNLHRLCATMRGDKPLPPIGSRL